ncbi:MAG TPA: PHB depolymerase family esterase [Gemmatimonadaceae bacterium]
MKVFKILIGAVLVIIGIPVVLILIILGSVSLANRTNGAIVSSGEKREYLLYVPKSYDRAKPTPLVISMHAAMNWPAYQMKVTQWNLAAEKSGFIVVYPAGRDPLHLGPKAWFMDGSRSPSTMPDVRFISELIDTLQAHYNIDPTRIYANGLSNGGGMAFALSCTLSHRIAAIGAVSAAQSLSWSWCADSTPVPMIAFHGTADPFVPYNGAPTGWLNPTAPFPNVTTWAANWARRNHCGSSPVDSAVAAHVTRREYTNCAENASVVLYTIRGGGHQWPGGKPIPEWIVGPMTREIDATDLMWAFFREHPLPRK